MGTDQEGTWKFLEGLEAHLNRCISPVEVRAWVQGTKRTSYESDFLTSKRVEEGFLAPTMVSQFGVNLREVAESPAKLT